MKNKFAVIDIGTNSVRLLLAVSDGSKIQRISKEHDTVRLGEGMGPERILTDAAMKRTCDAVERYAKKGLEFADKVYCFATSAVRDAKNKAEFAAMLKNIGVELEIIPGEEEALLGFAAVSGRGGMLDIGGGSTEIAFGEGTPEYMHSFNVGCVRGYDLFGEDSLSVRKWAADIFGDISFLNGDFIAIGGTGTSAAAMDLELEIYDPNIVEGHKLTKERIENLLERLSQMTPEERMNVRGLEPKRAKVITAGLAIMAAFMDASCIECITASETDNLEGYILTKLM